MLKLGKLGAGIGEITAISNILNTVALIGFSSGVFILYDITEKEKLIYSVN